MPNLYPFQAQGAAFLARERRACLFDSPGLGKTPQALTAAQMIEARTLLIVCPTFAIETWKREIASWWPELAGNVAVVSGLQKHREAGWAMWHLLDGVMAQPRAMVTTYRHLGEIAGCFQWDLVIYDEAHALTNRDSGAFKAAKKINSQALFLLTGTPTRKHPSELWNYLHLIDKQQYRSYWRWVNEKFEVIDGRFGKEIGQQKHPKGIQISMQRVSLRRQKGEVLLDLPPLTRQAVFVEPDDRFRAAYDQMANELLIEMEDQLVSIPNKLVLTTRLRQFCVCPMMLGIPEISPVIPTACEVAAPILGSGDNLVIFTPFRQAIPHIREALAFSEAAIYEVHGGQNPVTNAEMIQRFRDDPGPAVLLATISMAASWSANSAAACIFLGFSFSPIDHIQSEGRLHRHGQKNAVNAYYIGIKGSIDEHVIDVVNEKMRWEEIALDPKKLLKP